MNIFLNEYFGFWFELNFELNHFSARFNEKMNFQNVSYRASNILATECHHFQSQARAKETSLHLRVVWGLHFRVSTLEPLLKPQPNIYCCVVTGKEKTAGWESFPANSQTFAIHYSQEVPETNINSLCENCKIRKQIKTSNKAIPIMLSVQNGTTK